MARRVNHEGTLSQYATPSGEIRYRIAYWIVRPDGEFVRRFRRGFETERLAREALADLQVDIRRGTHVEDTRETLNAYSAKYFDGLRVRPTTLAGYRKHYRVHVLTAHRSDVHADRRHLEGSAQPLLPAARAERAQGSRTHRRSARARHRPSHSRARLAESSSTRSRTA